MELRDAVQAEYKRSLNLARKHYDAGSMAKASVEYLKCAKFLEHLADMSPRDKKKELLDRSTKFREIAEGLKEGTVKVYTDGMIPPEEGVEKTSRGRIETEKTAERVEGLVLAEKPKIKFSDIAGLAKVKENIKEAIVYPFKHPEEYEHFGVKPGGGILLYGPPGCGKTMIAAAAAAESDAAFISLKGSDIKDKYVGESEKNIKEIFNVARSYEKAMLFFDEFDSLAGERSGSMEGHERSLVSELLSQMDGLEAKGTTKRYLVLAATNRPWDVDVALRRSGRFDTTVFLPHPDIEARKKLLQINLKNKPVSRSVSLQRLAELTEGYASAEIADICEKAAMIPLGERIKNMTPRREITMEDFDQVLKEKKTVLASWYPKAVKELSGTGEGEMFRELIEAAREYR